MESQKCCRCPSSFPPLLTFDPKAHVPEPETNSLLHKHTDEDDACVPPASCGSFGSLCLVFRVSSVIGQFFFNPPRSEPRPRASTQHQSRLLQHQLFSIECSNIRASTIFTQCNAVIIILQLLIIFFLFCIVQRNKCVKISEENELFDTVTHGVSKSVSPCTVVIICPSFSLLLL